MRVRPPRIVATLVVAAAALFAIPSLAAAAPVQFGSALTPGPTVDWGCEYPGLNRSSQHRFPVSER